MQAAAAAAVAWGAFLIWEGTRPWDSQPNTADPCTIWVWSATSPLPHTRPHRLQTDLTFTNTVPHFPNVLRSFPLCIMLTAVLPRLICRHLQGHYFGLKNACFWNIQVSNGCEVRLCLETRSHSAFTHASRDSGLCSYTLSVADLYRNHSDEQDCTWLL